ncbi:carboxymuconolactone decarboxylase family protein [Mucilaginibacter boryungensis]|uniref:Carboxymuconolactone decarboxylase family protein n=1 Tax=Mucilaginibacter boryungensis TaxID=768480 RepID=A0ABR9XHK2_9SPHI|nr:carboxymuconolactone decarboxylase family protein [Mucilaginibacter boryungensis]MBE9666716.1 carboxymuconolactone decarboxylase family protein [Mucilaginibacter boryungensis]
MQRLIALDPETTKGESKELFNEIQQKLGMVPNMMRTMGNSPAVLNGYLAFNAALGKSSIGIKLGGLIALTVANANGCNYCNAAHSFIGKNLAHIDDTSLTNARVGLSEDLKIQTALTFCRTIVAKKGLVNETDVSLLKNAGYTDANIAEIIAHVGLNIFTNYFNNAANVTVDFPGEELVATAVIK